MADKVVGVLGGMGPEATVDLMRRVIQLTPATDDEDHIRMIVDNNPKVPSRIKAIMEGTGGSPLPCLVKMAENLVTVGADFLVIPCNTAHYYYDELCSSVTVPILNMVEVTVATLLMDNPYIRNAGLLAADAVLRTELYGKRFREKDVDLLYPSVRLQAGLMDCIRGIKMGRTGSQAVRALQSAADELVNKGAQALIVACTELSIIADGLKVDARLYDSAQILAEAIVRTAR